MSTILLDNIIIVIVCAAFVVAGIMAFIESRPSYDVHNFDYNDLVSVTILDKGLLGNSKLEITSLDSLKVFTELIKTSPSVDNSNLNLKASRGLCEIHLTFEHKKNRTLLLTNTDFDGGILESGDFSYRNDNLLRLIIDFT